MPRFFAPLASPRRGLFSGRDPLRATLLMASSLVLSAFPGLAEDGLCARLERQSHIAPPEVDEPLRPFASQKVMDCILQRTAVETAPADIHITYPAIGNTAVDEDIREYVTGLADAFGKSMYYSGYSWGENDAGALDQNHERSFELRGDYSLSRPSDKAVSVAFEMWNYVGDQSNMDVLTLNYNLLTGQRLSLVDIFEKPDIALELMSKYSRKVLEPRLGAARRAAMLAGGTEPVIENFSSLTLTPDGICINFQPWQVAPQQAGVQKVLMPLEELLPSSPLLALWGK